MLRFVVDNPNVRFESSRVVLLTFVFIPLVFCRDVSVWNRMTTCRRCCSDGVDDICKWGSSRYWRYVEILNCINNFRNILNILNRGCFEWLYIQENDRSFWMWTQHPHLKTLSGCYTVNTIQWMNPSLKISSKSFSSLWIDRWKDIW